nr:immunoglobulin heavy chain junction region [Macaca mulatta]MOX60032.1 immunoglobulin heavy chain junction region [Macaca mulatta]MOX62786.1 immunoglobulin heavy chain junction region [Macaca mulatta]MOX63317.1 immunoglobulin heavy chain junction region [Macaca mulatta]MOX63806.1 immunoglobulin heavy chain junction region [Macaca mulatta]
CARVPGLVVFTASLDYW